MMVFFLAAIVLLLGCGILFAEETTPQSNIEDISAFVAEDFTQLLDSEKDENVYVPVPVASGQTPPEQPQETDNGVNEDPPPEEEEPEEEEQDDPEQEEQTPAPSVNPGNAAANANTGVGGGDTEGGATTDKEYFTTNIIDGETVTNATYSFEIRHKVEELTPKSVEVFVNGTLVPQFHGTVSLTEGENTIRVKVDYADASGKIVATPYKNYTVYLDTKSLVINTSLKDETVTRDWYSFTASASYLGEPVAVKVTLNGSEVKEKNGGGYRVKLNAGANTFVLTAQSGDLNAEKTYIVTYESDGIFDFDTTLTNGMTVTEEYLSFEVWMVNSGDNVRFTASLDQEPLTESGEGHFTARLSNGKNTIQIVARDGEQYLPPKSYTVYFERPKAGAEDHNPDPKNAPTVETDPKLTEEEPFTTNNGTFTLNVYAYDRNGGNLSGGSMELRLNGTPIRSDWTSGNKAVYRLYLTLPENEVTIYVEDADGYSRFYTYTVLYENTDGPIGYATVSVEATTLGLGYLIEPEQVPIYSNQPASYLLKDFLENHGYTVEYTGSLDGNFYLARIGKPGITNGYAIPQTLLGYLEAENAGMMPSYPDSLGDKDFYEGSGWMVTLDGEIPGYGFGDMYLRDGQCVAIRFTLALGRDIGCGYGGNFPEIFIEQP